MKETVISSIRIDVNLYEKIKDESAWQGRTVNGQMAYILKEFFDRRGVNKCL
jgi:hypothetical protein